VADRSEYYSFEKALDELDLKEADLKRLVSEGEIRAFRDEDKMKFKKSDVEKLKGSIKKSDSSAETLADDLIFDEDEDLDLSDDEPGMVTEKISSTETLETLADDDDLLDDDDDEEVLESDSGVRRATGRATRIREAQASGAGPNPLFLVVLIVTTVALFYGIFLMINTSRSTDTEMTRGFTQFVVDMFGGEG